jgi:rubrerythrin
MSFVDPSWCARLQAGASAGAEPPSRPQPLRRREIPAVHHCELCGARMYEHNCKIVCPNCGYRRDCSDP